MDPRRKPEQQTESPPDGPELEETDWEAIESGAITPDSIPENGDIRYDEGRPRESLEEEADNAYQDSDEALPNDRDERAIRRSPSKEGGRFDEV